MAAQLVLLCLALVGAQDFGANDTEEGRQIRPKDTIPEYLGKYGIPVEEHWTTTEDGYILKLFRLARPGAKVVLAQHGVLCSSWHWLVNDPSLSVGIQLFNAGYDVWLSNSRGNLYSTNHTTLKPSFSKEFWNFTWADMGRFDVPANIAYVLEQTQQKDITFAGWSQGTSQFFVAMQDPKLRDYLAAKVNLFVAIAPVTYMQNDKSLLLKTLSDLRLDKVLFDLYPYKFLGSEGLDIVVQDLCRLTLGTICEFTVDIVAGRSKLDSAKAITNLTAHFPAGVSVKSLVHYAQEIRSGHFREYDYGKKGNLKQYGQESPPDYDMSQIKVPTALFIGEKDDLGDVKDNERLQTSLQGNPALVYSKVYSDFSHVTFFVGKEEAFQAWYPDLQALLNTYNPVASTALV